MPAVSSPRLAIFSACGDQDVLTGVPVTAFPVSFEAVIQVVILQQAISNTVVVGDHAAFVLTPIVVIFVCLTYINVFWLVDILAHDVFSV
jgi:hypothetical protein